MKRVWAVAFIIVTFGLTTVPKAAAVTAASNLNGKNDHLAGYQAVRGSSTDPILGAAASSVKMPTVKCTTTRTTNREAMLLWVGIAGGPGANDWLWQVGLGASCVKGVANYYAWYEYLNDPTGGTVRPIVLSASQMRGAPGDLYSLEAFFVPDSTGSGRHPFLRIYHSGVASPDPFEWHYEGPSLGDREVINAECMVERPLLTTGLAILPNFGKIQLAGGCWALSTLGANLDYYEGWPLNEDNSPYITWAVYRYRMFANGHVLATASPQTSPGSFAPLILTWKASK